MADLFGEIDCISKSDTIVMRLLRSAMDRTHEKVQSENGPIQFLHERSKFYELAAILVEGGLNIVQEEEMYILEDNRDKILSDLMEIQQWLAGRINDMNHLIIDKDHEMAKSLENESKLRQILDQKERELITLLQSQEPGKMKNESNDEGDINELKYSVDKQVENIKQKLELDEQKYLNDHGTRKITSYVSSPNLGNESSSLDEEKGGQNLGLDESFSRISPSSDLLRLGENGLIRRMSSDINLLKETLDLAFGRMQTAEMLPLEKQWRWAIEKDVVSISVKGFINDIRQAFGGESEKRVPESCIVRDNESVKPEIGKVEEESENLSLQIILMEDVYRVLFQGLVKDFSSNKEQTNKNGCHDLVSDSIFPETIGSLIKEDVYTVFIREMAEAIRLEKDEHAIESVIKEDIFRLVIAEAMRDLHFSSKEGNICSKKSEVAREESLIEQLDSMLKHLQEEGIVLTPSNETKKHDINDESGAQVNLDKMDELNTFEWYDDENVFTSVSKKLETALQQLHASKELIVGLGEGSEVYENLEESDRKGKINDDMIVEHENQSSVTKQENEQIPEYISPKTFSFVTQFEHQLLNFECMVKENLQMKCHRLDMLKNQVNVLIAPVASIRERKLLYKKAFISRCHNLKLAETEVDLLGDQVDNLFHLLEKLYLEINKNTTVLSGSFGNSEFLRLIERELTNEASRKTRS